MIAELSGEERQHLCSVLLSFLKLFLGSNFDCFFPANTALQNGGNIVHSASSFSLESESAMQNGNWNDSSNIFNNVVDLQAAFSKYLHLATVIFSDPKIFVLLSLAFDTDAALREEFLHALRMAYNKLKVEIESFQSDGDSMQVGVGRAVRLDVTSLTIFQETFKALNDPTCFLANRGTCSFIIVPD